VKQELPAGLGEGQIAEFVEDDEVHARQMIGEPSLPTVAGFGLEPVDEIDHVVKPAADAGADAASGDGDGKMGFAGAGPADQHGIALLGDEAAAGEVVHERLVDRRALELEVGEVLGERQLGDGELVLDRARLLLVDLGVEQITDDALGFVLAFDGRQPPILMSYATGSYTVCHHRYLDHGVSLQGARRSLAGPHTNDHPAGLLELGVQIVSGVLAGEHVHMIVVFGNLKVASTNYQSQVLSGPGELRGLQALEEVGLRPALFLNACLRRAHAMGDVRRRADFVGERR
jgi:hypothetical protein